MLDLLPRLTIQRHYFDQEESIRLLVVRVFAFLNNFAFNANLFGVDFESCSTIFCQVFGTRNGSLQMLLMFAVGLLSNPSLKADVGFSRAYRFFAHFG